MGKTASSLFQKATSEEKSIIQSRVAKLLDDSVASFLDSSSSPVKKGKFKPFKAEGGASQLFETGALRGSIVSEPQGLSFVKFGIPTNAEKVQRLKSFNHNVGDTLPVRQFVPRDNETFKQPILTGIKRIIEDVLSGRESGEES